MTLIREKWHCYRCKEVHERNRSDKQTLRNFQVTDCPRCRKRSKMVRLRHRPITGALVLALLFLTGCGHVPTTNEFRARLICKETGGTWEVSECVYENNG